MLLYSGMILSFLLIIYSVASGIFIGFPLLASWLLFIMLSLYLGHTPKKVAQMIWKGGKRSFVVVRMLMLIGAVISIWMVSGTIPTIIYYCLEYVTPHTFFFAAFALSSLMSFLTGTSLGTVSLIGIPLMIIARTAGISPDITAGAIIAGAYFGDRGSPMSSSAALVSNLTKTDMFINIKNMAQTSAIPFLVSSGIYLALSRLHPMNFVDPNLPADLANSFHVQPLLLLPVILVMVLSAFRVNILKSVSLSIVMAAVMALTIQHSQISHLLSDMVFGFKMNANDSLSSIIKGGGILSMLKTSLVIFISCSLAGLFEGLHVFDNLKSQLLGLNLKNHRLFGATSAVSVATAAFGCTQSISTIMTSEIMKDCYPDKGKHNYQFALDLENSGILLSALVPWNIAALVPTTTMNVSATGFMPYAVYLYIVPVAYFLVRKFGPTPSAASAI